MSFQLAIIPKGFAEAEKALLSIDKGFPRAAAEAINRGLVAGRKVAVMSIRERYRIKSGDVKGEGMKIKRAAYTRLDGELAAKGPMLPVRLFAPRTKKIKGSRNREVSVEIIKGNRKIVKGAFMTKVGKVMERRQASRYPIFPVSTIGVPFMVGKLAIAEKVQDTISQATMKRLDHNVEHALQSVKTANLR